MSIFQSPETVNVFLHGKRNCTDMMKLRILRWEVILDYLLWTQYNHKVLRKGRQEGQSQKKKSNKEWRGHSQREIWKCYAALLECERRTMSQGMQVAFRGWKRQETSSPLGPPKSGSLTESLILNFWAPKL